MDILIINWSVLNFFPFFLFLYLLISPNSAKKMHLKAHIFQILLGEHAPIPGKCASGKILQACCPHWDLFAPKFKILGAKSAPV